MRNANKITMEIRFVSKKDGLVKLVSNRDELKFAQQLDEDDTVVRYQTSVPMENWTARTYSTGIRKTYRETKWLTSFIVEYTDGTKAAYEVIREYHLEKRAEVEKLEISRRYWTAVGMDKWKMILLKGTEHDE